MKPTTTNVMPEKLEQAQIKSLGTQIVVVDNGFVYYGNVIYDDVFYLIQSAVNIRQWGTDHGLGQLRDGKTPKTVVDVCGEVLVPKGRVCHFIKATWPD